MDLTRKALEKARSGKGGGRSLFSVTSAPSLATVPDNIEYQETEVVSLDKKVLRANGVVAVFESDPIADKYRILRAQILRHLAPEGLRTLAICSANPGEGKTFTAVNLAICLAMDVNHTVLLVDLDLRHPSIAHVLGIEAKAGIEDYINGAAELSDCLVNPGIQRLVVLPVREPVERSSEMLASPKMARLAHELKNRYPDRIVIYDMPALLPTDDCLAFMPYVDATMFVVGEGQTSEDELERAMEMVRERNLIGAILNNSEERDNQ